MAVWFCVQIANGVTFELALRQEGEDECNGSVYRFEHWVEKLSK